MDLVTAVGIGGAGIAAGAINAIAGGGSLLTFPVLLAAGLPSVSANVTNTVGIVPGTIGGSIGYRAELRGQWRRVVRLGIPGVIGGLIGGVVLLVTPASVFDAVVPVLVAGACMLLLAQPRLARRIQGRREGRTPGSTGSEPVPAPAPDPGGNPAPDPGGNPAPDPGGNPAPDPGNSPAPDTGDPPQADPRPDPRPAHSGGPALWTGVLIVGVYAGYFGAAAGVMFLALFGLLLDTLQRANALKGVLAGIINAVAAVLFAAFGPVDWAAAVALGLGTILGGRVGAAVAQRIPDRPLRLGWPSGVC